MKDIQPDQVCSKGVSRCFGSFNRVKEQAKKYVFEAFSKRSHSIAPKAMPPISNSGEPSADDIEMFEKAYGRNADLSEFKPSYFAAFGQESTERRTME